MNAPADPEMAPPLHLFDGVGIEIELMLVAKEGLAVLPVSDQLLAAAAGGEPVSEVEMGELAWSNELVLHVIELKTNGPAPAIEPLVEPFERDIRRIAGLLEPLGGRLLGTAMHPLMDPLHETRLWPHEYGRIYRAYDRIFGCQGHGWSNLQSLHINLPFADDEEFGRLHAAIRLLLPLLPALAASSPLVEGRFTPRLDNRLELYRNNQEKLPSLTGKVIPEAVFTAEDYRRVIFGPMLRDIAPHDPEKILRGEFLNSRGAIARFDRGSIEIRLIDVQECPRADLAIALLVVEVLKHLVDETWSPLEHQQSFDVDALAALLRRTTADADQVLIHDRDLLDALGVTHKTALRAGELWKHLLDEVYAGVGAPDESWRDLLESMLERGPLARRLRNDLGSEPSRSQILDTYGELADCLLEGRLYGV